MSMMTLGDLIWKCSELVNIGVYSAESQDLIAVQTKDSDIPEYLEECGLHDFSIGAGGVHAFVDYKPRYMLNDLVEQVNIGYKDAGANPNLEKVKNEIERIKDFCNVMLEEIKDMPAQDYEWWE